MQVGVEGLGQIVGGKAAAVGENGELLVAFGDKVEAFAAGDVVHLR